MLQRLVAALSEVLRGADSLYRYGGEEILMLLPETHGAGVRQAGERARGGVEALGIAHEGSPVGVVTVSIGAAVYDPAQGGHGAWTQVVERADAALYQAKRGGRNRVEVAPDGSGSA